MLKKIIFLFIFLFSFTGLAEAQSQRNPCYYKSGSTSSCVPVGTDTPLPVTGSISASLGGFSWEASLTPVSASTSPVTTTITAGKTIVIQNIGTTNSAYCALGGTTSANATAIPPNSSVALTSTVEISLTCVTASGTTTLNLQSGTGLWTNFGGGSSGSGISSTNLTQIASNNIASGLTNGVLPIDVLTTSNNLYQAITSPPPLNINGVNQPWTGVTPNIAQTGTKYGANVDLASIAGTAPSVNSGNKDAGTLRIVWATDQPSGTNAQPSNFVAYGGSAVGVSNPVFTQNSDGTNTQLIDPCQSVAKSYAPVNISTATTTRIVAPTSAKKTYICSMFLYPAGTTNIGIVEGTGGTCGSSTAGVIGGTTAATGIVATATAGFILGNGGFAAAATAGTNVDFCLITSAAIQVSGVVAWVQR